MIVTGTSSRNKNTSHADRHTREIQALYRISRILTEGQNQRRILSETLDVLDNDLMMQRGTILLMSPDSSHLSIEVAHNIPDEHRLSVRYQLGEGVTGQVAQSGNPVVVPKVSQEPTFMDRMGLRKKNSTSDYSFICVPIKIEQEIMGALSVVKLFDANASLDEDLRFLSIVASVLAHNVKARRAESARRQALEDENLRLRHELEERFRPENIIGNSRTMKEVYRAIYQVANSDTTVLIRGESGTGKELVAQAIHYSSPRSRWPFVRVNCAALSETLLESELFGHEKGAFTGALQARKGRIEEAEGGSLMLDEIGDFSPAVQIKLLRILQEREFERVGSNKTIKANARIICVTNRDLENAVDKGTFRQDLYYRINVFPIFLPPLRDRKDDILLLADYFVEHYAKSAKKDIRRISTPAINMMVSYHWPGNVRELENCIERAVLLANEGVIQGHHLPPTLQTSDASDTIGAGTFTERVSLFERDLIIDALKRQNGKLAAAARDLNITPRMIRYKVKGLDIDYKRFRRK